MPKSITYVGGFDEVAFEVAPNVERTVKNGESIEVPDGVAASLLEQADNWQPTPAKSSKAAE